MKGSLKGRMKKVRLAKDRGLDAVMEAVVNSVQALADRPDGLVVVRAIKASPQRTIEGAPAYVSDFRIRDNGPGFGPENLESFDTLDSTYKEVRFGCKGVGRLLWLKVFERAEIDSVYGDGDGFRRVAFTFEPERNDYGDVVPVECEGPPMTTVTLRGCRPDYIESVNVQPGTLARRILNHCFSSFVLGDVPEIRVEYEGAEPESVNALFENTRGKIVSEEFEVEGTGNIPSEGFRVHHVRFYDWSEPGNRIEYCADGRTVRSSKFLPNTDLVDEEGRRFTYCAYVSSGYLDRSVNDERTDFDIPMEHRIVDDAVTFKEIESKVDSICRRYLEPYLARDRRMREELLDKVISNNPDVAMVKVHCDDILDEIDSADSEEEVYALLNSKVAEIESRVLFDAKRVLGKKTPFDTSEDVNRIFSQVQEVCRNNLTKYILHRKRIIEIFIEGQKRDWSAEGQGEYQKEDYIHDVLLPRRSRPGDIIDVENCNLWLIDEALNFYSFTSAYSDIPRKMFIKDYEDGRRPDIFVFSEMYKGVARSVTVVELKRPNRKDSDVVDQILDYLDDLRGKEIETPHRRVRVSDDAVLKGYILCDLTVGETQAFYRKHDFSRMHDGMRYYRWYSEMNVGIEVVDYTKLADDAEIRNRVFFDILGVGVEGGDPGIARYHEKHMEYVEGQGGGKPH